jgi:tetratricopeptide (TPR) repeat protein
VRALTALEDGRVDDAEKHVAALPDSPMIDRAWKMLLRGMVLTEREIFREAEASLQQACSLALICARRSEEALDPDPLRLSARALHHVGRIYRRRDRADDAYGAHLAAYRVREEHGSLDELWETAIELGLDARIARRYDEAFRWHRQAVEAAESTSHDPFRKQAVAWTDLCTSCIEDGRCDEAVAAARTARECWRKHDISAVTVAQADLRLGAALLKHGESLHERNDPQTATVLNEAVAWLTSARDALLAFGPDRTADAHSAAQQIDLAERLLASLKV